LIVLIDYAHRRQTRQCLFG